MFAGKIKLASVGLQESDSNLVTRSSAPLLPGLNLSDGCLGSDWCLGGGKELFNPPAAGVLWVGTISHKTLLSWELFPSSSFPEQSEQEWVIILIFCFVCSHQSWKRKQWISAPTDKLFPFSFCPSSEMKCLSCVTQCWNHTDVALLSILVKQTK